MKMRTLRIYFTCGCLILLAVACSFTRQANKVDSRPSSSIPAEILPTATQSLIELSEEHAPAMLPQALPDLMQLLDLTHYDLSLSLDLDTLTYTGQGQVHVTNSESDLLDRLYFRLLPNGGKSYGNGRLTVSGVLVNGSSVQPELSLQDTVLEIPLVEPIAPGSALDVNLEFSGQVPRDFGGGEQSGGYGIYNYTDSVLALSGWYPLLSVYDNGWRLDPLSSTGDSVHSDVAYYTVEIDLPADQVLAATGVEIETTRQGDRVVRRFVSGPVRDFFMIMSPLYQVSGDEVNGVLVRAHHLPDHEEGGDVLLRETVRALKIFNEKFGAYPYSELDVVEAPLNNALGVEYPGIFMMASSLLEQPQDSALFVTIAHETAHQWWYAVVGNDVFTEPWLDEGLATYSSAIYLLEGFSENTHRGFINYLYERYDNLVKDGKDEPVVESLAYFDRLSDPRVYAVVVYSKAALFLHALQDLIGDKAFYGALQEYYSQNKYGIANGDELLRLFESHAQKRLKKIYDLWLFETPR
jgi:hypothetical protein